MTVQQALGSRYVLEERIGSGGMGEIWRGKDLAADQPVAVKVLHERFAADPTELTRFVRERTILTGLHHPNLVPVRDMIMEGSRLAMVMDLVEGPDLHRYLRAHGPLAPAFAAALIAQVCDALAVVHAAGIVHRDLKPSNILLDTGQSPPVARLTDFGIARAEDAAPLTAETAIVGTPEYCAPEVIGGARGGPAVDIYAAGTSLYELLAGQPPFAGGPASAVFWRHVDAEPLRPDGIPESLWAVIAACLAKDPGQRPSAGTAARLLTDCLPELRGTPAVAPFSTGALRFKLTPPTVDETGKPLAQTNPPDLGPAGPPAPTALAAKVKPAGRGLPDQGLPDHGLPDQGPRRAGSWRRRTTRLAPAVTLTAVAGIAAVALLMSYGGPVASHETAGSPTAGGSRTAVAPRVSSSIRVPMQTVRQPVMPGASAHRRVQPAADGSPTGHARDTAGVPTASHAPATHSAPSAAAVPTGAATPQASSAPASAPAPAPASPTPTSTPALVPHLMYSFEEGTAGGWAAGANVASVTPVTSFANGPGHPYDGNYALDASSTDGAPITTARTISVALAPAVDLSAAQQFFVAVDGYGDAPYATGYTVTITLASGNVELIGSASVQPNAWTKLVLPIATWAQRGNLTSISISYAGVGSSMPWYPHFQIDDVGYNT